MVRARPALCGMSQMGLPGGAGLGRSGALALPSSLGPRSGGRRAPARWERTSCSRAAMSASRFFSCRSLAWARARAFFLASSAFKSAPFRRVLGGVFFFALLPFAAARARTLDVVAISSFVTRDGHLFARRELMSGELPTEHTEKVRRRLGDFLRKHKGLNAKARRREDRSEGIGHDVARRFADGRGSWIDIRAIRVIVLHDTPNGCPSRSTLRERSGPALNANRGPSISALRAPSWLKIRGSDTATQSF